MSYITSDDREQLQIVSLYLDDMVDKNNPCRVIDVFCEKLDMKKLGFKYAKTAESGRPPFDPRSLLKFETTNQANDLGRLEKITENVKEFLGTKTITALADSGYYDSYDILKCEEQGTTCLVPPAKPAQQAKNSNYDRECFRYEKEKNVYTCPEGNELKFMREQDKNSKKSLIYANYSVCRKCPVKDQCTNCKKGREISRSINFGDLAGIKQEGSKR